MESSVAALILNASALGILGYHLLVGLPKAAASVAAMQKELMTFFAAQAAADRAAFQQRCQTIADVLDKHLCERNPHP